MTCICKNAEGKEPGIINRRHAQVGLLNVHCEPEFDSFQELHSKPKTQDVASKKPAPKNKETAKTNKPAHPTKKKAVAEVEIGDMGINLASCGVLHQEQAIAAFAPASGDPYANAADAVRNMQEFLLKGEIGGTAPYTREKSPKGRAT